MAGSDSIMFRTPITPPCHGNRERVREAVAALVEDVRRDSRTAQSSEIAPLRRLMWRFAPSKKGIHTEKQDLAAHYSGQVTCTEDELNLRIARTTVALYLLDRADAMADFVVESRNLSLVSLFRTTIDGLSTILDASYFSKDSARIGDEYFAAEAPLTACIYCCSLEPLSLRDAVKEYLPRLAADVNRMNGFKADFPMEETRHPALVFELGGHGKKPRDAG
jgi:hypothetical protein